MSGVDPSTGRSRGYFEVKREPVRQAMTDKADGGGGGGVKGERKIPGVYVKSMLEKSACPVATIKVREDAAARQAQQQNQWKTSQLFSTSGARGCRRAAATTVPAKQSRSLPSPVQKNSPRAGIRGRAAGVEEEKRLLSRGRLAGAENFNRFPTLAFSFFSHSFLPG